MLFKDRELQLGDFAVYQVGNGPGHAGPFRNHAWGDGTEINFFFTRYIGIGAEYFSTYGVESPDTDRGRLRDHTVNRDHVGGNLFFRWPIESAHLAPYVYVGGGAEFGDRKWGSAYLTRTFFTLLGERLGDRVVLMLALNSGKPVAGALNLMGADTLYGRNWGCRGDWPFVHFELCYYRAIEFAIAHGLARVEAGAQGEHKIQRGYLPCPTWSAHWIADAGFREAVADFLEREREGVAQESFYLGTRTPFRKA